jgi:hypothetical protein
MYFSGKDLKCTLGQVPGSGLLLLRYFAYCYHHKVLTYVEYRTVSGVFQNIDPPSPSPPSECVLFLHKRWGVYTRRAARAGGSQYFGRRQS